MDSVKIIDIGKYTPQSVFELLYRPRTSCLLESSSVHPQTGRYSIIAVEPDMIYKGNSILEAEEKIKQYTGNSDTGIVPFTRGAIGCIGYDSVRLWENIGNSAEADIDIPYIYLLFYSRMAVFDHLSGKLILVNQDLPGGNAKTPDKIRNISGFKPALSREAFEDMVLKAKEYIKNGDIYQANLSQRFRSDIDGSGWEIYKMLSRINPSPFSAYMDLDGMEIISSSPERLFKVKGGIIETRPIAGTYPRGSSIDEDKKNVSGLFVDPKERAEHIMLVDLERNDLGRICRYNTVRVNELMSLESYSHVHHIVSEVQGVLESDIGLTEILKAVFPGGTITGCPKIRCMQIIEELEPVRRNLYTGSICYIGYNNMDFNIAIRTILKIKNKMYLQTGAGIVADSNPTREYNETLHKAGALIEAVHRVSEFKNCTPLKIPKGIFWGTL